LEKAIYGMAMPFNDCYVNTDPTGVMRVRKTNRESVYFESLVGITLEHDYTKVLGRTDNNLFLQVTDSGVYFKLIPDCPLGWSVYKKVKRHALRHCSISFNPVMMQRNFSDEERVLKISRAAGVGDSVIVEECRKINVFEICLTNQPANKSTFCTTDANDPRLAGLRWDEAAPIPEALIQHSPDEGLTFERNVWLTAETIALTEEVKAFQKKVQEVLRK
jgi:HK97 family phage prohead protease